MTTHRTMQIRTLLQLLFSLALGFVSINAMSQVDGPRARFEDSFISQLEGDWLLTRQIRGTAV